jgi:L-threonylcarbamoyladenylate synthase
MELIKGKGWDSLEREQWQAILTAFSEGQVLAYPTDTIYGLGALASRADCLERINAIKGRDAGKGMVILVGSVEMASRYCDFDSQREIVEKLWTENRPTSLILPYRGNLAPGLSGQNKGLAVRLPKDPFLRKMIEEIGEPIISTSANRSGQAPLPDGEAIWQYFSSLPLSPDIIIDFGRLEDTRPSRLLSLLSPDRVEIIRE